MLFGALRIMAQDAGMIKEPPPRRDYERLSDYEINSFYDLLRSPMTLSQGAAIMNEYRNHGIRHRRAQRQAFLKI